TDVVDSEIREAEGLGRRPLGASLSLWSGFTRRTLGTPFTSVTLGTSRAGVPFRSLISRGSAGTIGTVGPVVSVLAVSTRAPRRSPVALLSASTLRPQRPWVAPVSCGSLRTWSASLGRLPDLATADTLNQGKL